MTCDITKCGAEKRCAQSVRASSCALAYHQFMSVAGKEARKVTELNHGGTNMPSFKLQTLSHAKGKLSKVLKQG